MEKTRSEWFTLDVLRLEQIGECSAEYVCRLRECVVVDMLTYLQHLP